MSVGLDADFWAARMAYLARLAHTDALAVVLQIRDEGYVTYVAHNLASDPEWGNPLRAPLFAKVFNERQSAERAVAMPLADGRTAENLYVLPVTWKDQLVGALAGLRVDGIFGADDISSLTRVAELVGLELAEANALWRAQRSRDEVEARVKAARDMQNAVRSERDPVALLERATSQLAELFGADGVSIMLSDDSGELSVRSSVGLSDVAKKATKRAGEGISGYVAQSGESLLLSGAVKDSRFAGNDPSIGDALVAPLRSGDRTLGVVNVKHRSGERYSQAQLDSLTMVAGDIAAAFITAEALSLAEDDRKQAITLYELSRFATLGNEPQADLDSAVQMLGDSLQHDVVGVWVLEPGGGLRLRASRGYGAILPDEIPAHSHGTAMAKVLREKQTERSRYEQNDTRRPDWAPYKGVQYALAPIGSHGNVLGALVLGREKTAYTDGDVEFAATLGEYLSGIVQKTGSSDVVQQAASGERRRIAQELHDGLAQELTGVVLTLEGCQRALDRNPDLLGPQLAKAARDARATLADVRQYMSALRQADGSGALNLPVTVARLVDDLRRQTGLTVEMEETGTERDLAPNVQRAVLRIVGESLRNVSQHAHAQHSKVTLRYDPTEVVVTIEDDGEGFDTEETLDSAAATGHFGMVGMRERAEGVGGTLVVRSESGRGTIIRASIPYESAGTAIPTAQPDSIIEDEEELPEERSGFLSRLFGR